MSTRTLPARRNATNVRRQNLPFALAAALAASFGAHAADVVVQPAAGSGFVVKDASGTNERLRVQETGAITLRGVTAAPAQTQALCASAGGQLGPCSASGGTLPAGTVNQTLRYDASNTLVANNLLQAFDDGGLVAGGTAGTGNIHATGAGARMMWYPAKAAFRAGSVDGTQWDAASVGAGSVAVGQNTTASNIGSVALGVNALASNVGATAMGFYTQATGAYSTAMGNGAKASNIGATAMGNRTKAEGLASTTMGADTQATGQNSTAMGSGTQAFGTNSLATGSGTKAYDDTTTAMGVGTIATHQASTAMGNGATASGDASVAMGNGATASGSGSVAMGGGTLASNNYATAMGNSTIASGGSSTAMGNLTVASGDNSVAMGSRVSTNHHPGSFIFGDSDPARVGTNGNNADNQFMVVASGGSIFYTNANATTGVSLASGTGSWTTLSDRNAKTAVQPVNAREVLDKVVAMPLNTWQYKAQEAKYRHMGPMAQDFYAAFQLGETNKGIDTVDADGVALAAIQGLHAELAEKNREMTMRLKDKDAEIAALRAEYAEQAKNHDAQIATLRDEKNLEVAALQAELSTQKTRVATLESLAGEVVEMKAQLSALRRSSTGSISVAVTP